MRPHRPGRVGRSSVASVDRDAAYPLWARSSENSQPAHADQPEDSAPAQESKGTPPTASSVSERTQEMGGVRVRGNRLSKVPGTEGADGHAGWASSLVLTPDDTQGRVHGHESVYRPSHTWRET